MAMYLGEDKVASLGSICNVSGSASKNLFDAYKYSENNTHTGNVSKYSIINHNEIEVSYINGWSRLVLTLTGLEPNTDYTISAYLDKSNFSTSVGSGFYALDNYQDNAFTKGSGNVYFTFTSSSTGTFDMWFYGNWSGTNYSGSVIYKNIQLEKGSVTEYEEYYEPIILIKDSKGDYHEVPYMTGKVSKNLFNKDIMVEFKNGYRLYTDGTFNNNSSFYGLKIPVQPNTTYTSSSNLTDTNLWSDLCFFDKSMNFISGVEGRANKTFTTPANCYFVTYAIYNQYQWFQLEKGSNATEYEEYFEPTILIRNSNGIFQEVDINEDNYSLEEQVVGTWIDWKPLYRKVVNCGTLTNASSKTVAHKIANVKYIIGIKGFAYASSGTTIPLPFVDSTNAKTIGVLADRTNISIWNGTDRSSWNAFVILDYIKTTD